MNTRQDAAIECNFEAYAKPDTNGDILRRAPKISHNTKAFYSRPFIFKVTVNSSLRKKTWMAAAILNKFKQKTRRSQATLESI